MAHARLPFRKGPRRDSRYRCFYQRARRMLAPATCNERFPVSSPDWSQPATALRLSASLAGTSCFGKLCNPKVEHFHVSVRPEHDVLRLDVAMDNSRFVSGGERTCHLDRDVNSFTQLAFGPRVRR